jgi:hypothetical protein
MDASTLAALIVAVLVILCLCIGAWLQPEPQKKSPQAEAEKVLRRLQMRRQRTSSRLLDPITAALEGRLPINRPFDEMDVASGKLADNKECAPTGGITALMWACQWKLIEAKLGGPPVLGADVVCALLDAGADADVRCQNNGCSALSCELCSTSLTATRNPRTDPPDGLRSQLLSSMATSRLSTSSQHAHRCWGGPSGPRLFRQKPSLERCGAQ